MNWHCVMVLSPDTVNGYGRAFAGIGEAEPLPAAALQTQASGPVQTGYEEFRRLFRPVIEPLLSGSPPVHADEIDILLVDEWRELPAVLFADARQVAGFVFSPGGGSTMASRRGADTRSEWISSSFILGRLLSPYFPLGELSVLAR